MPFHENIENNLYSWNYFILHLATEGSISAHFLYTFCTLLYTFVHFSTLQVNDSYFVPRLQYIYWFCVNCFEYFAKFMCITFFINKINSKI